MEWINQLSKVPQKIKYSQNGEEYWLKHIFDNIGTTNKFFVDIGANDGTFLSNTKLFSEMGWKGLLVDGQKFPGVVHEFITRENILYVLKDNNVPVNFDLLSIDLDGNDYWVLQKILSVYRPRVIISEYNSEHPVHEAKTIEYDKDFSFDNYSDYYGYTFEAGKKLAEENGYVIIWQNGDLNLYYVDKAIIGDINIDVPVNVKRWWGGVNPDKKWIYV